MECAKKLDGIKYDYLSALKNAKETNEELDILYNQQLDCIEAREVIQNAAQLTQTNLGKTLSVIVTKALEIVFEDEAPLFIVRFATKHNSTACEMFFSDDGTNEMDPLDSCGFGAVDVASFALRISIWSMSNARPVFIADEPFRNLDAERIPRASEMVKTLADELGLQMIIVTHEEDLKNNSDKVFIVTKSKDKKSSVKEVIYAKKS